MDGHQIREDANMRILIEREQYKISVDVQKNRLFFEVWGDLVEPALLEHFADDWTQACSQVTPGFTLLCDYTQHGVLFIQDSFAKGMVAINEAGVYKVAAFYGKKILGRYTTEQAAAAASSEYATKRKSFETRAEAEAWLAL